MFNNSLRQTYGKSFLVSRVRNGNNRLRSLSTDSGSRSSGRLAAVVGGSTAVVIGGTIAYSKFDPKFRASVEKNVPLSNKLLNAVLGPASLQSLSASTPEASSAVKDKAIESGLMKKRLERESKADASSLPNDPKSSTQQSSTSKTTASGSPASSSKPSSRNDPKASKTPNVLQELDTLVERLENETKEAVSAQISAIEAIKTHSDLLSKAIETEDSEESRSLYNEASKANESRQSSLERAQKALEDARLKIQDFQSKIDVLKKSPGNFDKEVKKQVEQNIVTAEEAMLRWLYVLENRENEVVAAQSRASVLKNCQDLIEEARKQLEIEFSAIKTKDSKTKTKETENEDLQLLLAHAHKRLNMLLRELAVQKATLEDKVAEAVQRQKEEDEKFADTRIALELSKHRTEIDQDYNRKINAVRDKLEDELRQQLKRQLAAHSDHLREQLSIQRAELDRHYQMVLEDKLMQERSKAQNELTGAFIRLADIEVGLEVREKLDKEERKTKELWLMCQLLRDALRHSESSLEEAKPIHVATEVEAVKKALIDDELLRLSKIALDSIPKQALDKGVYSEDALISRFEKIDKVASRVALIGEEGGSLFRYLLSYLQSLLIIRQSNIPEEELAGKTEVDPSTWDTYDILARVRHAVSKRDLDMAVRFANQLKGASRKVALDWIKDVRLHLETRQAADILVSQAASLNVQAMQ